ncbi:MAG TPA: thioredoxin [Longimicrobiales bacterium]|nr:thioredoxin [Longimicrobiales bacterium]
MNEAQRTATATIPCAFCGTSNRVDLARAGDRPKCGKCGKPFLLDRPVTLTEEAFDRTIAQSTAPVLVDFYADWCAPCKVMAPVIDRIARERMGELVVGKLDTDHAPGVSARLGIRGIPTFILFRDGAEVARETGAVAPAQLEALAAR